MSHRGIEHLTANEQRAVHAFLQSLQEHLGDQVLQTILFGSKARGDGTRWSDIDILITVREESWPLRAEVSTLAADVSLEYGVLLGPRVIGQERWERMKQAGFGLYKNVAAEGVPLPLPASRAA
jgi:predicted nucleotidyltransferase